MPTRNRGHLAQQGRQGHGEDQEPDPDAPAAVFAPGPALEAGQALLAALEPVAVFEHVHGRRDEKREVRVLLGGGGAVYGRFNLDPSTLEPVPIGLEGVTLPLAAGASPEAFYASAQEIVAELSLSAVVVPEREGYKLLLVYAGRIVGELKLNLDYTPRGEKKWLEELERSR